jgi:hypothetical protein
MIRKDIEQGAIETVQAFSKAMSHWFSLNTHRHDHDRRFAIGELRRTFESKMSTIKTLRDRTTWVEACNALRCRIDELLLSAPAPVQFKELRVETRAPTQHEVDFLMNKVRKVVRPLDVFQVTTILGRDPSWIPSEQSEVTVDLTQLQPSTFFALFDFLYSKFSHETFEAPTEDLQDNKSPKNTKRSPQ